MGLSTLKKYLITTAEYRKPFTGSTPKSTSLESSHRMDQQLQQTILKNAHQTQIATLRLIFKSINGIMFA
jgi:hypothetical protein